MTHIISTHTPYDHILHLLLFRKKIFEKSSFESAAPPPMPGSDAFLDAQEEPEDTEPAAWADEEGDLDLAAAGGDWGGDLDLGDLGAVPDEPVHVEDLKALCGLWLAKTMLFGGVS